MEKNSNLIEKKLRGSGGYVFAKINDNEQKMANLGGPELFLAGIGRLETDRFVKYYCNKCEKGYEGNPNIQYENPNEDLGENIILIEKGEYKCKICDYTLAQYRRFNDVKEDKDYTANTDGKEENTIVEKKELDDKEGFHYNVATHQITSSELKSDYNPVEKIINMLAYDDNAQFIGKVSEIGLRKTITGKPHFSFKITKYDGEIIEIDWDHINKIGDIIILHSQNSQNNNYVRNGKKDDNNNDTKNPNPKDICINCSYKNDVDAVFCEECGKKLL